MEIIDGTIGRGINQ